MATPRPGLPRKVLELVRTDVADLFSGIRTRKPALIGSDRVGRRGLISAVCRWNRVNRRTARLKCDRLCLSTVVSQADRGKQRIDPVAVVGRAGLGEATGRVIGDVVPSVGDRSTAFTLWGPMAEGAAMLFARMVLLRLAQPELWMPPPVLPEKVLLVTVNTAKLSMPPTACPDPLPKKVLLVTDSVPSL